MFGLLQIAPILNNCINVPPKLLQGERKTTYKHKFVVLAQTILVKLFNYKILLHYIFLLF